jgi:hypothetical protein
MPAADGCDPTARVPAFGCRAGPPDALPAGCTSLGAAAVLGFALSLQPMLAIAQINTMPVFRALRRRSGTCGAIHSMRLL